MGREIRRVPANWEHPRRDCKHSPWAGGCDEAKRNGGKCYQPLYDRDYEVDAREWLSECIAWENGTHKDCAKYKVDHPFFWNFSCGPPNKEYYRPKWTDEERTHQQVYETVSEGTPVTPAFATKEELVEYLVANGDRWDQHRGDGGWKREAAESFVKRGWAMSGIGVVKDGKATLYAPRDGDPT